MMFLEFVTCATPAYLAAHAPLSHPSQLEDGHTLVRYFFASTGRQNKLEFMRGDERVAVSGKYAVAVNDSHAYLAAGLAGMGVIHNPAPHGAAAYRRRHAGSRARCLVGHAEYAVGGVHAEPPPERARARLRRLAGDAVRPASHVLP